MQEKVSIMMLLARSGSDGGPVADIQGHVWSLADIFAAWPISQSVWDDRPAHRVGIEDCP